MPTPRDSRFNQEIVSDFTLTYTRGRKESKRRWPGGGWGLGKAGARGGWEGGSAAHGGRGGGAGGVMTECPEHKGSQVSHS